MAAVAFAVECSITKPGEVVFVTGGHAEIGGWDLAKAIPLGTCEKTFPTWTSQPVVLPAGEAVEYKYIVQQGNRSGKASWEEISGNRQAKTVQGALMTLKSVWQKADGTQVKQGALPPNMAPPMRAISKEPPPSTENAQKLANQLDSREAMRKNFSQSLLCLDSDADDADGQLPAATPAAAVAQAADKPASLPQRAGSKDRPSVALKHISSFSALTEMAAVEEKEQARKGRKESSYKPYNLDVPIVIVTSEVAPYSKTGGLGLVAASYSYEFPRKGHRTMVVSPKYKHFEGLNWIGETRVIVNGREELVKYWHKYEACGDGQGCDLVFVGHDTIERGGGLYNSDDGREYPDNLLRFTLLSMAAMEAPLILKFGARGTYGDKVLFLANDWQAGLVPFYLNHKYRRNGTYNQSRAIYVVHNLGYQGQYPKVDACHFFGVENHMASDLAIANCVNLSKAALINADRVLTVSPNYTKEVQTPQGGFKLESFVRAKGDALRLGGILNGIDDVWNPETDKDIACKYSVDDFEKGKAANKAALQKQLGLREDPNVVLIGFCGRLTWQKGVDVMVEIVSWLMNDSGQGVSGRAQLIMMGNGEKQYADKLRWGEGSFPGRVCGYVGFDPKVEHQMMAGCDLFLMPSRYEPCGLPQMYAQRYGTLPVVTATGGLVDSVKDISQGVDMATGFHMSPLSPEKMKEVVHRAGDLYLNHRADFRKMQRTAMEEDFYWPQAMDEYEKAIDQTLYDQAVAR